MEPLEEVSSEEDWSEEAWAWSSGDLKDWVEPSRFTRVLGCAGSTCIGQLASNTSPTWPVSGHLCIKEHRCI